jgi:antitoxin (DNA-binding transcriptional repressor) of toxin-antitoxin stability system
MRTVNIRTAKTHLSRLLNEVATGKEVSSPRRASR